MKKTRKHALLGAACGVFAFGAAPAVLADPPAHAQAAMKVKIDKETGKMRAATAAEAADMDSASERQLAADWWNSTVPGSSADGIITLPDGTQMKRMDVDSLQALAIEVDENGQLVGRHTHADGDESLATDATIEQESDHDTE